MRCVCALSCAVVLAACSTSATVGLEDGGGGSGLDARSSDSGAPVEITIVEPGLPADVASRFPEDTAADVVDAADGPRILYPSHETMFPRNLAPVNHQWRADTRFDVFELRFDSALARIRVYTTARSYQADAATWAAIAETHAGASAIMSVRAVDDAMSATVWASQRNELFYSASEVLGALYYWSTGAQGVMRGHISAASANKFFTDPATGDDRCVACHTVSRDGRRLAVGYDGERLRQVTIPDRDLVIPASAAARGPDYGWGTFSPGAARLLYANRGVLRLLDADSGASLVDPVELPAGAYATHPDWSPDGRWVAFAYVAPMTAPEPNNKEVRGSSLARMPVLPDGTFGPVEVLRESDGPEDTIFFPSYSPDSQLIAFARGVGRSKDNETATLWLMRADGSSDPIAVTRLNERVADRDGVSMVGNTMPTWAPSTGGDVFWLAFSSIRDYGAALVGAERDQLWAAAIDPGVVARGDPSYAAFWMPFQQIEEGNHRAFWALATEDECPSEVELCDELDNDCDGIVDDACCTPVAEVCWNAVDDDCDGVADEGCGCMETEEDCFNAIDDDCDGLTDAADEDCLVF